MRLFGEGSGFLDKLYYFVTGYMTSMGFMLWGKGGGGSSAPASTTSTSYSTNLPEYAQPYYTELMKQAGKQVYGTDATGAVTGVKSYTPYTGTTMLTDPTTGKLVSSAAGQRLAGFTPEQIALQGEIAGLNQRGQFKVASEGLDTGSLLGYGAGVTGLKQAFGYKPTDITTGTFGAPAASAYMSPYASNVTDIAVREAEKQRELDKSALATGALGRGTFGGARNALLQAAQTSAAGQNIANIRTRGLQDAYMNAQQQFNTDQARALQAQQATQQGQQYAAGLGQQIGLAGLTAGLQGSQALGALGAQQQAADISRLQAQEASALQGQNLQQKQLDQAYQDWQTAQNYPKSQLEYLSNILRGNAGALGSTQVAYSPQPSTASQVASMGLAGLGLYNAFSKV